MRTRLVFGAIVMMLVLALPAHAGGKDELQKYFSNVATKVKATDDPSEKRAILNSSFQTMSKALDVVQWMPLTSKDEGVAIARFKATLQEKQDELAGVNGFTRVSDKQLNDFSNYVVQDMEQADVIVISLGALLLIILILILIL